MSGRIAISFVEFPTLVRLRSRSLRFVHAVSGAKLVRLARSPFERGGSLFARPVTDDAVYLQEMLSKLLEGKAERKEPFRCFAFHVARQSGAPYRAEILDIALKRYIDSPK